MGCERIHRRRGKKCFYSLSKGGKGPDTYSSIGPDAWVFESFTEFKEQSVGTGKFISILVQVLSGLDVLL